jgi:hypothetical protein
MLGEKIEPTKSSDKFIQGFIDGLEKPREYAIVDLFQLWLAYAPGYPLGRAAGSFARMLYGYTNLRPHRHRASGREAKCVWIR